MAVILIKDLPENFELDRQAMLAIAGGSRARASSPRFRPFNRQSGIFKYRDVLHSTAQPPAPQS